MTQKKKRKIKQQIIIERHTSGFIFLIPIVLSILTLTYGLYYGKLSVLMTLLLVGMYMAYAISGYYKRKVVVTNNKVYYYFLGKKNYDFHYVNDFYMVHFQQDRLGKFFNYGTLILIDQDKKMYQFHFLPEVFQVYEEIIIAYEDYMTLKNPNYEKRYERTTKKITSDSIDSLEDDNSGEEDNQQLDTFNNSTVKEKNND